MIVEEFTHLPLNEEIQYSTGSIWLSEEVVMDYGDRQVLYVIGHSSAMGGCCAGWFPPHDYIHVIGYLLKWQYRTNENGCPVSQIEPIRDEAVREEIKQLLRRRHMIDVVEVW